MVTQRQQKILYALIKEYLDSADPVSSDLLKQKSRLTVSPATIRNELQHLTQEGYITQPHTSSGRVPTDKGYRYFIEITFHKEESLPKFIEKEIMQAREKIERELELANELAKSLSRISLALNTNRIEEDMLCDMLKLIGPSQTTYEKHINMMEELIKELENF